MAKLPKYMEIKAENNTKITLVIKKWGLPFLIHKALRENFEIKWYHWVIIYPHICIKAIRGGINV